MIIKSYEIKKNIQNLSNHNFYLMYGENVGLKYDIRNFIKKKIKEKNDKIEILSLSEEEILSNEENFYDFIYSGSLFSNIKILTISQATDKMIKNISAIYDKKPENIFIFIFSNILEKKSKLRNFFETNKEAICIACYPDSVKDLEIIANTELTKNNISISREGINLLIEKSNSDRINLRNEIEKIISYSLNKKSLDLEEIKSLINFSGDYKSDILINECLSGNVSQYKKIISEIYFNTVNYVLLLRILSNKVQRLLKIKELQDEKNSIDNLINFSKPAIFWKEKPIVKKHLILWSLKDLKKIIKEINNTELMCKRNPQISKVIFFNFFLNICTKTNNYS
jgi:DNA polymerase-3 subunit delta